MQIDSDKPGKIIAVNDNDDDGDGIPDFADGFNLFTDDPDDGIVTGEQFTPVTVSLPQGILFSQAKLTFTYDDSDPSQTQRTGDGTKDDPYIYTPGEGILRLWDKAGDESRNKASIADGGDWIESGQAIDAADLGFSSGQSTITLWLEAVHASSGLGDQRIVLSLDSSGSGSFDSTDAVRLTSYSGLIRVDNNRDGQIKFDPDDSSELDRTSSADPYRFWINNNNDYFDGDNADYSERSNDDPQFVEDSSTGLINNARDLEDFSRLRIIAPPGYDANDGWSAKLTFTSIDGAPSIRLFKVTQQQSDTYLSDVGVAGILSGASSIGMVSAGGSYNMDMADFVPSLQDYDVKEVDFLFEGVATGSGTVTIEFDKDGKKIAQDVVNLQLQTAQQMYETYETVNGASTYIAPDPKTNPALYDAFRLVGNSPYTADSPETDDYILFVHGWRMKPADKTSFANTAYKRLFWQGYKGKFGAFDWPTEWIDTTDANLKPWNWDVDIAVNTNYARSEEKAWYSAAALNNLLVQLAGKYHTDSGESRVNMLAHSMGNIVASEALRITADANPGGTPIVNTYVASQAASWTESYDGSGNNFSSPDDDEYHWLESHLGHPYFHNLGYAASHLVNFYNPVDYALGAAITHERYGKLLGIEGYTTDNADNFIFWDPPSFINPLNNWDDRYSILAYVGQAITTPLGMTANVGGPFDQSKQVNLQAAFGFTNAKWDHSAEFNSTIELRSAYWRKLIQTLGVS